MDLDVLDARRADRGLLEDLCPTATLELEQEQAGVAEPVAAVAGVGRVRGAPARQEQSKPRLVEGDRLSEGRVARERREPVDERHSRAAQEEELHQRRTRA